MRETDYTLLNPMKVKDVMSTEMVTVAPDASFRDLWKAIFKKKINAVLVVDTQAKLLGIIAKESLLERLYPDERDLFGRGDDLPDFEDMEKVVLELTGLRAKDIMTKRLIYTREDTPVMRALSRMIVRGVNQLPVLTDEGKLVGVITKGDIFYSVFKTYMKRMPKNAGRGKKKK